jgi:ketosteroid isomerase-like protein
VFAANLLTLVRELYDAFARQDLSAALARRHPDVEIRQTELVPRGGHYRGHEGAREFFGRVLGAIDSTVTVERFIDAATTWRRWGGCAAGLAQAASRSTCLCRTSR